MASSTENVGADAAVKVRCLAPIELSCVLKTPIGALKLVANPEGICAVKWLFGKYCATEASTTIKSPSLKAERKGRDITTNLESISAETPEQKQALDHLRVGINWISAYFDGSLLKSNIPRPPLVFPMKGISSTCVHVPL